MKLHPYKYDLFICQAHYIGQIISVEGIRTLPKKYVYVHCNQSDDLYKLRIFMDCDFKQPKESYIATWPNASSPQLIAMSQQIMLFRHSAKNMSSLSR